MPDYTLIGDIGGTHARFALTDATSPRPQILQDHVYGDSEFASLGDAARHYLDRVGVRARRAVLAVAAPIRGDNIHLTNRGWSTNRSELQRELGLDALRFINDFAAIGWAVPFLAPTDRLPIHGEVSTPAVAPVTLVGAGTGLGVGLLVGSADAGWHVIATEGGHANYAPADAEDRVVAAWLRARYGRVSSERALSGNGLCHIDAALRGVPALAKPAAQPDLRSAEDITRAALAGTDADAQRALARFCRIYGAVAGDAALLHGAHTVLIAGGVVLHMLDYFRSSGFMDAFTAKGRNSGYMQRMAVQVITHANPGLLGAAVVARDHENR